MKSSTQLKPRRGSLSVQSSTVRPELDRAGTPVGPNDLLIAATARAHRAVLVTHNVRMFSRVADLRLEDWESR